MLNWKQISLACRVHPFIRDDFAVPGQLQYALGLFEIVKRNMCSHNRTSYSYTCCMCCKAMGNIGSTGTVILAARFQILATDVLYTDSQRLTISYFFVQQIMSVNAKRVLS